MKNKFSPSLSKYSLRSDVFKVNIKFKLASSTLKLVKDKKGIDNFLLKASNKKLTRKSIKIKKKIFSLLEKKYFL